MVTSATVWLVGLLFSHLEIQLEKKTTIMRSKRPLNC